MIEILTTLIGGMPALASFFGGTVFRMVWGEVSAWYTKKQDHAHEMEMVTLQGKLEAERAERMNTALELQSKLGIQVVEAKSEAAIGELDAAGFWEGVKLTGGKSGVTWVDGWNASIRPAIATWAVLMLTAEAFKLFGIEFLTDDTKNVISAALGLFLASRDLAKRGK